MKLAADLDMPGGDAKAQEIWLQMVTALQKTDAAYKAAPAASPGSHRKDLASDGFQKIMGEFNPIISALNPYMEKYSQGKKTWAFWSGRPAMALATSGGSSNYVFPASKAGTGDSAYKAYGYPKFAWTVQTVRDIAEKLINKELVSEDDMTMFLAAMAAEPNRNIVAEVTNLLVLGPSTPGTNQAFKANRGDMPMTTGGTIRDPRDTTLDDTRQGTANSSGKVTDQEVQIAKDFYKKSQGKDLETVIDERGETGETRMHVKGVLRAQFHR